MHFRIVIFSVTFIGLLFTASCSPSIRPQPAPQPQPDISAYSTKAAGDATIVAAATPSPYYFELVAIDGILLASKNTKTACWDWFACTEYEEYGLDGWKSAFISPGYHCVTSLIRDFQTADDRSFWTGGVLLPRTSCFDVKARHTYVLDMKGFDRSGNALGTSTFPVVTDKSDGRVILPLQPSGPVGGETALVSFSGNAVLASIDGKFFTKSPFKPKIVRKTRSLEKLLNPDATLYEVPSGYHTITLSSMMVGYHFPAGRDIRLESRNEGIYILDGETGAILKSPGSQP